MKLFLLFFISSPIYACRALPVNYSEQVDKMIEEHVQKKGLVIEKIKKDHSAASVTAKSKNHCRHFEFATGIRPDCRPTLKVLKEVPCR